MRSILAIGFIAIFISACNSLERTEISLEEAIPSNAALILKVKDPASLKRDLRNCDFIPSSSTVKYGADLLYIIGQLKELQTKDEGYLVAIPNSSDSLSYVYISEIAPKEQTADSVETDSIRVEPELIEETTVSSVKWFTSETGNLRFSSIDSLLVAEKKWLNSTSYPGNELLSLLKNPAPERKFPSF